MQVVVVVVECCADGDGCLALAIVAVLVARAANDSEASAAAADMAADGGSTALPTFGGMFVVWIVGNFSCRCSTGG